MQRRHRAGWLALAAAIGTALLILFLIRSRDTVPATGASVVTARSSAELAAGEARERESDAQLMPADSESSAAEPRDRKTSEIPDDVSRQTPVHASEPAHEQLPEIRADASEVTVGGQRPTPVATLTDAMYRSSSSQNGHVGDDNCVMLHSGATVALPRPFTAETAGFVANERFVVIAHANEVCVFELPDLRALWSKSFSRKIGWPAIASGFDTVLAPARNGGEVFALDIRTGELKWQRQYFDCVAAGLPNCKYEDYTLNFHCAVVSNEMYHLAWNRLFCTKIDDGSVVWHSPHDFVGGNIGLRAWCVTDEHVYLASCGGPDDDSPALVEVMALRRSSGQQAWLRQLPFSCVPTILAHGDGTYVHATESGLFKLDAASGLELWRQPKLRSLTSVMAAGDGRIVVAEGSTVRGIDTATGEIAWATSISNSPIHAPWPAYVNGTAIVVGDDGFGLELSQLSGDIIGQLGERVWSAGGVQLAGKRLAFVGADLRSMWFEHVYRD